MTHSPMTPRGSGQPSIEDIRGVEVTLGFAVVRRAILDLRSRQYGDEAHTWLTSDSPILELTLALSDLSVERLWAELEKVPRDERSRP